MNNRKKFTSFFIALVFALSLLFNNFTGLITIANATETTQSLVSTIDDGAILHAWNWSFDTIKSKLPEIKEAGYTAVQTSPIQGNKEDLMANSKWWILYQPTNFKIGNAQLGTREQFKNMCEEADKYGVDIIVDVVANHTGNRGGGDDSYYPANNVDSSIKDDSTLWHEHKGVSDWNNRWQVTHLGIGLPDLNTSSWKLQDMVISFLNDAIACGADGFRFDAAKHIELPDDDGGSDFWPRVLNSLNNKENLFIYGEVLQGGADRINAYHTYMRTTTDWYGGSVRSAVGYHSTANVNNAKSYTVSGSASNLVTWVESHDTYANDGKETVALTNEQIKLGWAIIAGRSGSTPLFFNRTAGGYLAGNMGSAGDDMWKDPIVVAANDFRNNMAGEGEYIRTQGNNVFITERGTKGIMIVNVGDGTSINCDTKLANGQYIDSVSGNTFTVSNGKLTGNIGRRTIATIYATQVGNDPQVSSSIVSGTKFVNSLNITLSEKYTKSATYSINGGNAVIYTNGKTITLGSESKVGDIIALTLSGIGEDGKNVSKEYKYEKVDVIENATAKIKLPSGWSSANIYVYDESVSPTKEVAKWPGVAMTNEGNGVYSYTLPDGWGENTQVIFNNGNNQIPAAQQPGLLLKPGEVKIYENNSWNNVVVPNPEVSSSIADGTQFTNSLNITLNAKNTVEATYSIDGGRETTYTDGKAITIGKDTAIGSTVKLTLIGKNSEGKTTTKTYTYKKIDKPVVTTAVAKIKLPSGWSSANIYVYDESVSPTKEVAKWPGVAMTNEGNGVYSYTLPDGWGENTQVIFNNGNVQIPAAQQPGLSLPTGKIGTYENGMWTLIEAVKPIKITSFIADKVSPQVADTTIKLSVTATGGNGTLEYKFTCRNTETNEEKTIRGYSTNSTAEWTPITAGTYKVSVTAKDSQGNTKEESFEFTIDPRNTDIVLNSINLDKTEVNVGEEISISADATGGLGSLSYKFYYKKGSEYTTIKDYSSESSVKWAPEEEGEYYVYVDVRDSAGNLKYISKKVTVSKKAVEITDVIVDKATIKVGDSVNVTTIATGASSLQYRVAVHDFENTWTTLHEFKDSNVTIWKPEIADKHVIWVDVIDEDGGYASKSIEVTVIE